jgi:hypothetical protein
MDSLNTEQQERLIALITELETLPTAERIVQSAKVRCPLPVGEAEKKRMRAALAGAFAAEKVVYYLQCLRFANRERNRLNRQIANQIAIENEALTIRDAKAVATSRIERTALSGLLEVMLHTFAVYAWRIAVLLPIAARASSVKIDSCDQNVLNAYEGLRHHFEHIEERLPGKKHAAEYVTEWEENGEWKIQMEFGVDSAGRFVINGTAIDVTDEGLREIERVAQKVWEKINQQTIEEVRTYFTKHPADIPDPSAVDSSLLFSTWTPERLSLKRTESS